MTLKTTTDSPLSKSIAVIGGKWKTIIIYVLKDETLRFGQIKKEIPKITQKMLTQQLRELEKDGLVNREVFAEVPLRVEYSLTEKSERLKPILAQLCKWGTDLK